MVAAFSHATRVDDTFIKELVATPDVCVKDLFAFTEAFESVSDQDTIPLGLRQMKIYGMPNPCPSHHFFSDLHAIAESFYNVNYGSSIIKSKVCQIISVTKT